MEYIERILAVIISMINSLGYWGIGAGMLLESACIPLPSEVVLPLAGNMVANGSIGLLGANMAVAVGSLIGSYAAYAFGYFGGRPFIIKYGHYFFISEKHFYQAEAAFKKYGSSAVLFGRLLPIIRTFISLPAGIARLDIRKFTIYSLLGMLPWNFVLIYLGYVFGQSYGTIIRPVFKKFEYAVVGIMVLLIIGIAFKLTLLNRKSKFE